MLVEVHPSLMIDSRKGEFITRRTQVKLRYRRKFLRHVVQYYSTIPVKLVKQPVITRIQTIDDRPLPKSLGDVPCRLVPNARYCTIYFRH